MPIICKVEEVICQNMSLITNISMLSFRAFLLPRQIEACPQYAAGFIFFVATKASFQEQKKKIKPGANEVSDRLLFAVKPNSRSRPIPQCGRGSNLCYPVIPNSRSRPLRHKAGEGVTCFLLEFHSQRYFYHPESFYLISLTRPGIINAGSRVGVVPGVIILFCANIHTGVNE